MSLPRTLFSEEHDQFRDSVRRFMATEVSPNVERYETQQFIDREVWVKGGEAGYLCPTMPEAYGSAIAPRLEAMTN